MMILSVRILHVAADATIKEAINVPVVFFDHRGAGPTHVEQRIGVGHLLHFRRKGQHRGVDAAHDLVVKIGTFDSALERINNERSVIRAHRLKEHF